MPKGFEKVVIQRDGTATVTGPFSLDPGEPQRSALVSFYIVQGDTTVGGDGRWSIDDETWTGTCGGGLTAGASAWGYGMAILVQDEPPGFATWTWTAPLDVTEAADTPT